MGPGRNIPTGPAFAALVTGSFAAAGCETSVNDLSSQNHNLAACQTTFATAGQCTDNTIQGIGKSSAKFICEVTGDLEHPAKIVEKEGVENDNILEGKYTNYSNAVLTKDGTVVQCGIDKKAGTAGCEEHEMTEDEISAIPLTAVGVTLGDIETGKRAEALFAESGFNLVTSESPCDDESVQDLAETTFAEIDRLVSQNPKMDFGGIKTAKAPIWGPGSEPGSQ